jgi:hypothetical protein
MIKQWTLCSYTISVGDECPETDERSVSNGKDPIVNKYFDDPRLV